MQIYIWKKKTELKKSTLKCLMLLIFPIAIGLLYTKVFPLDVKWFYFMFPISVSVLIYFITYNVDDIACAGIYELMGIPRRTQWLSGSIFCAAAGYAMTVLVEVGAVGLNIVCFDDAAIFLTLLSIPCTFSLLGLSRIHYLTNSRTEMMVASIFSIFCLAIVPIAILANRYFPINRWNMVEYGLIAFIFVLIGIGTYRFMGKKSCLETLIINSKIYIEGYDKNFFMEE